MLTQEDALKNLAEAVVKRDRKKVEELAQQVVAEKLDAFQAIDKGLAAGMEVVKPDIEAFRAAAKKCLPEKFGRTWGQGVYEAIFAAGR